MEVGAVSSKDEKRTATSVALPAHGAALTKKAKITTSKSHHQSSPVNDDHESLVTDADDCCSDEVKGSSTLGFIFKEGVMLATDHYDSSADASDVFAPNVIALNKHVLVTVSVDIPDTRSFLRDMRRHFPVDGIRTVAMASKWVARTLHYRNEKHLTVEMLIAGWDKTEGFSLYHVNAKGELRKQNGCVTGTGAPYIGHLFNLSEFNGQMSYNEAEGCAKKWIQHAAHSSKGYVTRQGGNGETYGFVSGYSIGVDGYKCVFHNENAGKAAQETHTEA